MFKSVDIIPDKTIAQSFTRQPTIFVGKFFLKFRVGNLNCLDHFYVMPPKIMIVPIILGKPLQSKYRVTHYWDSKSMHFKHEDGYVVQAFVTHGDQPTTTIQEIVITSKGKHTIQEPIHKTPSHDNFCDYISPLTSKPLTSITKKKWIPKGQIQKPQTQQEPTMSQLYASKNFLVAQQGSPQIWIPKGASTIEPTLV